MMNFGHTFVLALWSVVVFASASSLKGTAVQKLGAHYECTQSISEMDCMSYATSVGRQMGDDDNTKLWGTNGNARPKGCFIDESDPSRVFYNPGGGNYTGCNLAFKSICEESQVACEGYFCDKSLSSMFLFMTHNSYATDDRVFIHNQNFREGDQFDAGIRGFNFDIYDVDGELSVDHTPNCNTWTPSPYIESVGEVLERLDRCEHQNEIVVVDLEMKNSGERTNQRVVEPWGDKVIKNFNSSKPFSYYIAKGQRVLLLTNKDTSDTSVGIYRRKDYVTQNGYDWTCTFDEPDFAYREGPKNDPNSAKLMNHFCYTFKLPDEQDSERVNDEHVIMSHSRKFSEQPVYGSFPNIIMVDFYDKGSIWPAQDLIRGTNKYVGDELEDGTLCAVGTTCMSCKNEYSFWNSKAMTACGSEPCLQDGSRCASGTTCNTCCSGSHEYWDSLLFTACGRAPCSDEGTLCWSGSSCGECCSGEYDCPWYGLGYGCSCE